LTSSAEHRSQLNAAKNRILEHQDLQAWLAAVWQEASNIALDDLSRPESQTRAGLERGCLLFGRTLANDEAMLKHLDALLERLAVYMISFRSAIGTFIAEIVSGWDTVTL